MSWEKDMSAAAMTGEPGPDVTAENTWHGFGSDRHRVDIEPYESQLVVCLQSAAEDQRSDAPRGYWTVQGNRLLPLPTLSGMLVDNIYGGPPLFSAAELGGLFEFFRGGDAD